MRVSDERGQVPVFLPNATKADRARVASGFATLARQDELVRGAIAGYMSRLIDPRYPLPPISEAASELGIPAETFSSIVSAVTLITSALYSTSFSITIDDFLSQTVEHGFVQDEDRDAVASFFKDHLDAHRRDIRVAILRDRASSFVAPSFSDFQATTDVRVFHDEGKLIMLPIALVLLQTDVEDKDLVFQMTLRDAVHIRRKLDGTIKKLEELRQVRLGSEASDGD